MSEIIISAKDIVKSYPSGKSRVEILKGLSLDVGKGESISIVGKSGSGKSTLLGILSLLLDMDSGTLEYYGCDVSKQPKSEISLLRMKKIGYLFQSSLLMEDFTALENVMMPLLVDGVKKRDAREKAEELVASYKLEDRMNARVNELSGGEKERFALLRSIIRKPDVLFLDEPTGALDEESRNSVIDSIFSLSGKSAIVLVTHDKDLGMLANRRYELEKGVLFEK